MCGRCYEDFFLEYNYSHEPPDAQKIRLRQHAFRIWDEQPTILLPLFRTAGDANTPENRIRYAVSPRNVYRVWGLIRGSIGRINSASATARELIDAIGQDAATDYIEEERERERERDKEEDD